MGFADLLARLDIPYASNEAVSLAESLMKFIQHEAVQASRQLARARGSFPNFDGSRLASAGIPAQRNACVTSIAPTGTIALLADCSGGIEPFFALSYRREVIGDTRTMDVHPYLVERLSAEAAASAGRIDVDKEIGYVRETGHLNPATAPLGLRHLFPTSHEIAPDWHIRIQAAFQRHTDTAVSKTINLANSATRAEIADAYRSAFESGCKGVTVFRDGSKDRQVLRPGAEPGRCPECGEPLVTEAACRSCHSCGYSVCMI
jgi:ribonucleoside-diphosphate reductase alpha chain